MPLDSSGTYVSLDNATKIMIYEYAANKIRQGITDYGDIGRLVGQRFGNKVDGYDWLPVQNLIGQAQRAVDFGRDVYQNPAWAHTPADAPNVPGDPGIRGEFIYTVVVIATNPTTGDRHTDVFPIHSTRPYSQDEIRALVESQRTYYLQEIGSPKPDPSIADLLDLDVAVIGGGRVR